MKNNVYKLQKRILVVVLAIICFSCKSTHIVKNNVLDENQSAKTVIRNHYYSHLSFKTLSGKMKIDYSDGTSSQSVTVSIRMEKDKAIWLSAPLGMVKAYITQERVSFYNKLSNEYFDGNFDYLSQLLGTDLNFEKVQNLLLGQAIYDLRDEKYEVNLANGNYQLQPKKTTDVFKLLFQIEHQHYKMASQQISQPLKNRKLEINYPKYQTVNKWIIPDEIHILAKDGDHNNTISMEFRNMEFNKALSFPYSIPNGFKEVILQ